MLSNLATSPAFSILFNLQLAPSYPSKHKQSVASKLITILTWWCRLSVLTHHCITGFRKSLSHENPFWHHLESLVFPAGIILCGEWIRNDLLIKWHLNTCFPVDGCFKFMRHNLPGSNTFIHHWVCYLRGNKFVFNLLINFISWLSFPSLFSSHSLFLPISQLYLPIHFSSVQKVTGLSMGVNIEWHGMLR